MFHHVFSRFVAISLLCLAGMSLGCSDATSPIMPTTPTAPTASTPVGPTLLSVSPSSGPTIGGDYIRVSGSGFQSGVSVTLDGVATRVTRVTATFIDARTLAHAAGTVDIVVTNPDGQAGGLKAAYSFDVFSVTGGPNLVAPGAELTVSWVAPSGRGCNGGGDWIAIYRVGTTDEISATNGHSDIWYDHVCGATSGTWKLKAPDQPGQYEFRFMVGDFSVARSNPITVRS
jgi:IPT/TIG domain-containing protein